MSKISLLNKWILEQLIQLARPTTLISRIHDLEFHPITNVLYCANDGDCDISVPNLLSGDWFANLAMDPEDESDIYAGYISGLYKSTNSGSSWGNISGSRPSNWCVSTCRSNADVVYIAGSPNGGAWNGTIDKLVNNSWSSLTVALQAAGYSTNLKITDIDVSRTNHNLFYLSVGGSTPNSKVFVSNNGGTSFTNLSYNLPNTPIFCVKTDELSGIYVGTSIGVYYLAFGSTFWEPFYNGLPTVPVSEIELSPGVPPYNTVYAATFGRGIWSTNTRINCSSFVTKSGAVNGAQYFEAGTQLTSTQTLIGGQFSELKLNSGNRVRLLPGFQVTSGNYMKTYLEGCGADVSN